MQGCILILNRHLLLIEHSEYSSAHEIFVDNKVLFELLLITPANYKPHSQRSKASVQYHDIGRGFTIYRSTFLVFPTKQMAKRLIRS